MIEEEKITIKEEENEKAIAKMTEQITESNKKIDDSFDERLKRLTDKKRLTPDEKEAEEQALKLETLNSKLLEVKELITDARKAGKDPFIADLMLKNIKSKIQMFKVTNDMSDYNKVENILKKARLELDEAIKEEEINVKKEIENKLEEYLAREGLESKTIKS